jgi:hypothetical protein
MRRIGIWRDIFVVLFTALIGLSFPDLAAGQTDLQRAQNLASCLTGKYPSLCKRQWLTADELRKVESAERQENLRICLTGKYPSLCRKDRLTPQERDQAIVAEASENRRICLTGQYRSLCKKNLLTDAELKQVLTAERTENLRMCLKGLYPSICDKSLLTQDQLSQVTAAERRAAESEKQKPPDSRRRRVGPGAASLSCEAGHWVESVAADGRIVKLEDGSIWEVDAVDAIDSALWLPTTDIVVCGDKLINTEDNETVSARRIR